MPGAKQEAFSLHGKPPTGWGKQIRRTIMEEFEITKRIQVVDPEKATGELREIFDDIERVRGKGKITAVFRAMGVAPEYLKAHWMYNVADKTKHKISIKMKEMISTAVSTAVGCKV